MMDGEQGRLSIVKVKNCEPFWRFLFNLINFKTKRDLAWDSHKIVKNEKNFFPT